MKNVAVLSACAGTLLVIIAAAQGHPGPHHDVERLTAALAQQPDSVSLWIERAYCYRLDHQPAKALADLDHARTLAPANRDIHSHRGLTLIAMQRHEEAEEELNRFLETGPGSAEAFAARAGIRERAGRQVEALSDYTAALALRPEVELVLARGRLQESMELLDEAATGYREGLAQQGGAVSIRQALIRVEIARRQYDTALSLIDEALGKSPIKTHWHLRRAEVFEAAGQAQPTRAEREQALAEANRALAGREAAVHLLGRAQVYVALGRTAEAKRDLRSALTKSPHLDEARRLLDQLEASYTGEPSGILSE